MINDLLVHDGQIAGAVGYGTRDGCMHIFRVKAVIMAAGRPNRLYKTFSGLVFNKGKKTTFGMGKTFGSELKTGAGPIYADMSWGSEEDQAYMRWAISNEGSGTAFHHLNEEYGINFRKHKIEIRPIEPEHSGATGGGPIVNAQCQTSVPGLFAAGDEVGGIPQSVVPGALTMGYLSGESAFCPISAFMELIWPVTQFRIGDEIN